MTSLPPLADVLAVRSTDPSVLHHVERAIRRTDPTRVVQRPSPAWVVWTETVPPSPLGAELGPGVDLFFTEGAELFDDSGRSTLVDDVRRRPRSLDRLAGDFGFLHVASDESAVFVRSCGGRVPVYLRVTDHYVALATRLSDLVAVLPDEPALDPLTLAIWAIGWSILPDDRTFFRGIKCVPRGHVVAVDPDGRARVDRYWDPRPHALPEPTAERRAEHVQRCRTLLLDYLARELAADGNNLLTLSGGVDSSSLAALAAGSLGYPVSTLSLLPTQGPARDHAMTFLDNLRNHYRFERVWDFPLDYRGRVDAAVAAPRVAFPVTHSALGLLPQVLEEGPIDVLFGGEFADHVCGAPFTFPDWLRHISARELVRRRSDWPQGRRTAGRWIKHRALEVVGRPYLPLPEKLPDYVQPDIRAEYLDWRNARRRALAGDERPLRYLALEAEIDGFVAMNWEVTSALGVRRAWPFFNRAMLELAFDCHPAELVGPGTKKLLRAALDGQVPALNLHRRDRGGWRPPDDETVPAAPVPELACVFDLERLPAGETDFGLPASWCFRGFLDAARDLRSPARSERSR